MHQSGPNRCDAILAMTSELDNSEIYDTLNGGQTALERSERRYRNLFQFVPVPVFRIDRSELAQVFELMKADGVDDLVQYQEAHPEFLDFAMNSMKIVEVNRRAVELFGARDASEVVGPVARLWSESPEICLAGMQRRYQGGASFEAQMRFRAFNNQVLDVLYLTDFPEALKNEALGLACLVDIKRSSEGAEDVADPSSGIRACRTCPQCWAN